MATTWEIHDGKAQIGPLDEEHVLRMIAAGLPDGMLVRPAGSEAWVALRAHPAFAFAVEKRGAGAAPMPLASVPLVPLEAATNRGTTTAPTYGAPVKTKIPTSTIVIGGVFCLGMLGMLMHAAFGPVSHSSGMTPTVPDPETNKPASAAVTKPANPLDVIMTKRTAKEAFAVALPMMIERPNDTSPGGFLFSLWALQHLLWTDVAVSTDETSYARVKKDVDAERGKRFCVSGQIIEIASFKQPYGTLFSGLLINPGGNLYRFSAVKSTGDLVEQSPARFCGYVMGNYDYSNSAGGTGHAVDMVGIFDLPENKK